MTKFTPIAFASEHWDKKINEVFTQIFAGGRKPLLSHRFKGILSHLEMEVA